MKPFKVHLRRKPIKNGQESLFLDFGRAVFHAAKNKWTRRHFLGVYIYTTPKNKTERIHNRETLEFADKRRAEILLEIQSGTYGTVTSEGERERQRLDLDFLELFRDRMGRRRGATKNSWLKVFKHLENFTAKECRVKDISKGFLLEFKDYLDGANLEENTKYLYFLILKTAVKEIYERGTLEKNFGIGVKNFSTTKAQRPFFLDKEVKLLKNTPFPAHPDLRRIALFSVLTSLRWSDARLLRYEMIKHDKRLGYYIEFKIKKVNCPDILYLTDEALELCEYEPYKKGRIFPLPYYAKKYIKDWFKLAGIEKPFGIGFHIFRHTFAMRALNKGESLENVSAMMGHRDLKTTQIYARLLAETKRSAIHRVTLG